MRNFKLLLFVFVLSSTLTGVFAQSQSVFDKDIVTLDQITENREYQIEIKETFFKASIENILIDESQKNSFRYYFKTNKEPYKTFLKEFIEQENGKMSGLELKEKLNEISNQLTHDFLKAEQSGEFSMGNFKFIENLNDHYTKRNQDHDHTNEAGAACNNPDMETCDFIGWDLTKGDVDANPYGYVNVVTVGDYTSNTGSDQHFIVTGGNDPVVPTIPMVNPNGGGCTAQLGDGTGTGGKAASMSQTFLVDANSANFTYSYAAIMEDPSGHALGEKPYFKARVYDENGVEIVCGRYNATAGDGTAGWVNNGTVQYKDWTTVFVPLQAYIGTNVRVEFTVGDCSQSGHYGYAYVEASCSPGEILGPDTITCLGPIVISAPAGADSYLWNTGATTQSITVSTPGTYDVDVIPVTGPACAINLTKDVYEFIDTVQAVFSVNPDTICAGQSISFNESSVITGLGAINSWDWDFDGDGNIDMSTQNPPPQVYNTPGIYDVNLSVATTGCVDDTTIQVVVNPLSTANFTAPAVCVGATTIFTDASSAGVDSWNWDFDNDGTIDDTGQNPNHTFSAAGTYPVNLEVSVNGACTHDTTINVIVHPKPTADFTVNDTCLTLANQFNDNSNVSSGTITGWDWDFDNNGTVDNTTQNPTNTYGASGTQTIELVVTTNNTCKDTITKTVEIFDNPVAAFVSDTACEPFVSTMTDATVLGSIGISNWDWDFDANATIDNTLQNPTNTFGVAGSYPVTLNVTDSNGCTSSVTENVIIAPKPTAAFNFLDVCFGANTTFTDQSNGNGGTIDTWEWDFTNNGSVDNTNQTPIGGYGYPSAGNYDASLVVTTAQGCKDTVVNEVDVDAIPVANFSAAAVCLGDVTMFYDSSVVANSNIVQWNWDFENDLTVDDNLQNPTYTYPSVGSFNASLNVVSDSGCFNTVIIPVDVSPNPIANFTTDTACLTLATTFTDVTTLGLIDIEYWEWDFDNDGNPDDGNQNPTFTFAPAGTYPVNLNVIDSLGCSHDTTLNVTVSENPIAAFTFSDECFNVDSTQFISQSLDNGGTTPIDTWQWDFDGDGIIDNNTNDPTPANLFDSAGVYQTMLVVTSTLGCNDTAYVNVDVDDVPVANFGGTNECLGNVTTFTDSSSVNIGNVNQWDWDFGDGVGTSTLQNPTYTYTSPGIKNVTLTVYSDSGCTHTFNTNVEVYAHPIANFTPDTVCNSSASSFTDVSSLASFGIATWTWDFGDGIGSSNDQNPSYGYNGAGDYLVNLSVVDSFGCGHDTTKTVTVSENPFADFTFSDECFNENATSFTNLSHDNGGTTSIDTWSWDFDGDGIEDDNTQTPTNLFDSAGVYTTQLIVTSTLGCKDTAYVVVDVDAIPVANFGLENVCLNYAGTFTDSSTVAIDDVVQWSWNFGDGVGTSTLQNPTYTYTSAGIYNVVLDVVSDSGCTNSITLPVEIYPNPTANFDTTDVCLNVAAQFTDQSVGNGGTIDSWSWDFDNNGTEDDTDQYPSYNYLSDGTYNVELIVSTTSGCKDTLMKSVTIYPMPTADFTFVNSCFMDSVEFTDNSNVTSGTINQWQWNLSDGQSSTNQNPSVYYSNEGIYDVELTVTTNNNCKDTITKTGIEVWPLPNINFGPTAVCINYATQFTDSSTVSNTYTTNNNVQWDWDFGNGVGSSMDQNPVYAYPVDGVYMATLTVTTNNNCVDSATKPVTVYPQPEVDFVANNPTGCTPVEVNFTDLTVLNGGNMATSTWEWDVNSDGNTDLWGPTPLWQFTNPSNSSVREFDITLTVTSEFGCVDSLTKTNYISSYPIPLASFSFFPNDDATIVDNEIEFTDQSIIASTWQWDLGDGTQTTVTHPIHEYADTGSYWVTLNIENEYGCIDSTAKLIRINPIYAIWIPNAFTPNGDNTNDYFYVDGYGIKELQVQIYDRWGLQLYDGIGLDQAWDGTYKGELVQLDVYVYKVRAKDVFDEWHDYIGKVTVVE